MFDRLLLPRYLIGCCKAGVLENFSSLHNIRQFKFNSVIVRNLRGWSNASFCELRTKNGNLNKYLVISSVFLAIDYSCIFTTYTGAALPGFPVLGKTFLPFVLHLYDLSSHWW